MSKTFVLCLVTIGVVLFVTVGKSVTPKSKTEEILEDEQETDYTNYRA